MSDAIQRQLDDLQRMTTSDLVERYEDLHGHACRTRHRAYLIRKIAWRIQAKGHDLPAAARARLHNDPFREGNGDRSMPGSHPLALPW
jgi:hypothetical protein